MARAFTDVRPAAFAALTAPDADSLLGASTARAPVADGPGWYESSRDLLLGLIVHEWSQADATQLGGMPA